MISNLQLRSSSVTRNTLNKQTRNLHLHVIYIQITYELKLISKYRILNYPTRIISKLYPTSNQVYKDKNDKTSNSEKNYKN